MSDTSQGYGWWLASDGKWYAPHLHPDAHRPTPTATPAAQPEVPAYPSAYGAAPAYGAPAVYGAPPLYGAAPVYGAPPAYGAGPAYGAPPGYGYGPGSPYGPPPGWVVPTSPVLVDPVVQEPLAPWWKRLVAIIVDAMLVSFTGIIILLVISAAAGGSQSQTQTPSPKTSGGAVAAGVFVLWAVMAVLGAVYYGALNGSARGQTVGKMALGIAVRDARGGGPIGFWRGFGRSLITWAFSIPLAIPYVLDSLAPLWDRRRQAWHDKVAHSVVVDLRP